MNHEFHDVLITFLYVSMYTSAKDLVSLETIMVLEQGRICYG